MDCNNRSILIKNVDYNIKMMCDYKSKYTFEERCERTKVMKSKYPDKIPIVLISNDIKLKSTQFLVGNELTFAQFICLIRKNYAIEMKAYEAIFCVINKVLPPNSSLLSQIYTEHSEPDGILYVHVKKESTFG